MHVFKHKFNGQYVKAVISHAASHMEYTPNIEEASFGHQDVAEWQTVEDLLCEIKGPSAACCYFCKQEVPNLEVVRVEVREKKV